MSTEQQVVYGGTEAGADRGLPPADNSIPLQFTSERLRVWGARAMLSLVDQGLTSGAGFIVNLLLAKWMGAEIYGAFAVAFAGFLFISGFHNVLLLEPMSVLGPSRYAGRLQGYFRAQLVINMILLGAFSQVALVVGLLWSKIVPDSPLPAAILGAGLILPFLLLLWLLRRMCYVVQRPAIALTGSASYLFLIMAGLVLMAHLERVEPFTVFLLMGCASIMASALLVWRLGVLKRDPTTKEPRVSWREVLRENWTYGRWLVGSTVLYAISSQTQMFLVAGLLGLGAAGALRAMQLPGLVMSQVVTATGILVLPAFSQDFGTGAIRQMRQKAFLVSGVLLGVSLLFAATLLILRVPVERLLFGGKYSATAWLMPLLALVPAANSLGLGFSVALRARQRPEFDLFANAIASPVGLVSAVECTRWWGLPGAASSMVLSFVVASIVTVVFFKKSGPGRGFSVSPARLNHDSSF